nr:phosphoenolpyruvate synthase [FCB group bacterium]
ASTYDSASDRVIPGIRSKGPRLINFASVLTYESIPLNDLIKNLLIKSREYVGADVELEFAVTVDPKSGQARFGLLQIRPMLMSREDVTIADEFLTGDAVIVRSNNVLGNGKNEDIRYILYVKPETFDKSKTREISEEIAQQNEQLLSQGHQYILIGFGRWGSSDPWLGIPVVWANISAARAIVECTTPEMNVDLSQGSHFFHNLTSMQVPYLSVRHSISNDRVNWEFLNNCDAEYESQNIRLIQVPGTITVQVDGNRGIGVINDK